MAIPNFRINPYVQPYVGNANPELGKVIDQRIAQYDVDKEVDDVLGYQTDTLLQNVSSYDGDINYAKQIINDTRNELAQRAERGDYENMEREVKRSARNFASKASPLFENQKRISEFQKSMDDLYRDKRISIDTYSKSKSKSLGEYKGIDPNNIQGSMFSGFVPSPDINVSDKVDKFLKDWKENGGTRIASDGYGGYSKIDWTKADENEIARAAQEYLAGDSEYTNYVQTQNNINNLDRVIQTTKDSKGNNVLSGGETYNAINAGMKKYGFLKTNESLQWDPEYIKSGKDAFEFARNLPSTASPATINPNAVSIFKATGTSIDEQSGKILNNLVSKEGDEYFMYKDEEGKKISKSTYDTQESSRKRRQVVSEGMNIPSTVHKIKISEEEATKETKQLNEFITGMASERFLNEAIEKKIINSDDVLNNQKLVDDYLRINQRKYTSPKYLVETAKQYEEAIGNSEVINDNRRWDISTIPGAATPETTSVKDDEILANLTGQSIGILSVDKDIAGFRKGQTADLNSLLDKLQENKYNVSVRKIGPTKYNPFSKDSGNNSPGMEYSFILKKEGEPTKVISAVASIEDQDLQPVQDVYNLAYKGMYGRVPFYAPNSLGGETSGFFRVRTSTKIDPQDNKRKFNSFVEILDSKGNKINIPGFPQNIPVNGNPSKGIIGFADVYKNIFAPNLINKYIKTK